ncbi:MAG TPA: ribosome maturation factor RimP [Ilumatobacter sp.]
MSDTPMIQRVRELVDPIASDLDLDVYDVEQRGGTLRVTLDTRPGASGSVDLEQLSLATRLISRELDHADPVPGRYTLEVTSPGVERSLRTPAHFQREIGKTVSVRLANVEAEQRRLEGVLVAADERTATIRVESGRVDASGEAVDHVVAIDSIDRARTVFVWGPQPKPGKPGGRKQAASAKGIRQSVPDQSSPQSSEERS